MYILLFSSLLFKKRSKKIIDGLTKGFFGDIIGNTQPIENGQIRTLSRRAALERGQSCFSAAATLTYRSMRNVMNHHIMVITVNTLISPCFHSLLSDNVLPHKLCYKLNSLAPRCAYELCQIVVAVPAPTEGRGEGSADEQIDTQLRRGELFIQNVPLHMKVSVMSCGQLEGVVDHPCTVIVVNTAAADYKPFVGKGSSDLADGLGGLYSALSGYRALLYTNGITSGYINTRQIKYDRQFFGGQIHIQDFIW